MKRTHRAPSTVVVSAALFVFACASAFGQMTAGAAAQTAAAATTKFTVVLLPDTQNYSGEVNNGVPATFNAQVQWCLDNRAARNILYVSQLGDITNNNSTQDWDNANASMSLLDATPPGMPYGFVLGNHDFTAGTSINNNYFPVSRFAGRPYYGGHYGSNNDHHFDFFASEGLQFIVVNLSFGDQLPTAPVLAWADSILKAYSTRHGIVVNHYITDTGNPAPFSAPGQAIYDALKGNPNLFLMLAGHIPGAGRRSDTFNGNIILSVLSDYQSEPNGGNGWLRIMEFDPPNNQIHVSTYSPTLNQWWIDADNQFDLSYAMGGVPLPIQLAGFTAAALPHAGVCLSWVTLSETENYGFEVQRSAVPASGFAPLAGSFTPGHGTTVERHNYAFTDSTGGTTKYYYRLKQIDMDATVHYSEVIEASGTTGVNEEVPLVTALDQNYPNPFNPTTVIRYQLPVVSSVTLGVYDILGRVVATLVNGMNEPGMHSVTWDANGAAGGVYFYRLQAGRFTQTKRLVLLR